MKLRSNKQLFASFVLAITVGLLFGGLLLSQDTMHPPLINGGNRARIVAPFTAIGVTANASTAAVQMRAAVSGISTAIYTVVCINQSATATTAAILSGATTQVWQVACPASVAQGTTTFISPPLIIAANTVINMAALTTNTLTLQFALSGYTFTQ
jgi:hypothetical protein